MEIIEKKYAGQLVLGDKVDITDPCYDKDIWCRQTVNCWPGTYEGYAFITNEGDWGKRVAMLGIFQEGNYDYESDDPIVNYNHLGTIGVDAGLAGFFNNKQDFNDDEWMEFCGSLGDYKDMVWNNYGGIFSSSGYGDGCYDVYANRDRNAFVIVFIDDWDEDEEWEDEDYD